VMTCSLRYPTRFKNLQPMATTTVCGFIGAKDKLMMLFMGALRHMVRIAGMVLRSAALRAGKQQVYNSRQNAEPCTLLIQTKDPKQLVPGL